MNNKCNNPPPLLNEHTVLLSLKRGSQTNLIVLQYNISSCFAACFNVKFIPDLGNNTINMQATQISHWNKLCEMKTNVQKRTNVDNNLSVKSGKKTFPANDSNQGVCYRKSGCMWCFGVILTHPIVFPKNPPILLCEVEARLETAAPRRSFGCDLWEQTFRHLQIAAMEDSMNPQTCMNEPQQHSKNVFDEGIPW